MQNTVRPSRRRVWLFVVALVVAGAWLAGRARCASEEEARLAERRQAAARANTFGAGRGWDEEAFMSRFTKGFRALAQEACKDAGYPTCSAAQAIRDLSTDERSGAVERGFMTVQSKVRPWLAEVGALPALPVPYEVPVSTFLEAELHGAEAPFSTVLALYVYRNLLDLLTPGLLRRLVEDPPGDANFVRFLALDLLAEAPGEDDLPFLREQLGDPDTRIARRSLRAIAKTPGGPEHLSSYLWEHSEDADPSVAREVGDAMADAGLLADDRLLGRLIRSENDHVVSSTLSALARKHVDLAPGIATQLEGLASPEGHAEDDIRSGAVEALALGGEVGQQAIERAIRENRWAPRERLLGAEAVYPSGDSRAAELALRSFRELDSPSDVQLAATMASRSPEMRSDLVAAIRRWLGTHPGERQALIELLSTSRTPALVEIAALL